MLQRKIVEVCYRLLWDIIDLGRKEGSGHH